MIFDKERRHSSRQRVNENDEAGGHLQDIVKPKTQERSAKNSTVIESENNRRASRSLSQELFDEGLQRGESDSEWELQESKGLLKRRFRGLYEHLDFVEAEERGFSEPDSREEEALRTVENQLEKTQSQLDEFQKTTQLKMDQLTRQVTDLAREQDRSRKEWAQNHIEIRSRLQERRLNEVKTMDLMDRHNQIVNDFESRLSQLKKTLSDRELKFIQLSAALDEARLEIRRLKKL